MQSFTWGSDEGMEALIAKHNDKFQGSVVEDLKWSFIPNPTDFETLIHALWFTAENEPSLQSEPAADLLSSIAESLGIEFI